MGGNQTYGDARRTFLGIKIADLVPQRVLKMKGDICSQHSAFYKVRAGHEKPDKLGTVRYLYQRGSTINTG